MEYLNWMAEHYILTVVLFLIVFGGISTVFQGWDR